MESLLKIPYELQIVLVAGYIAYKVISIGKGRTHRTEDFLLQVLTFGLVARSVTAGVFWLFSGSFAVTLDEAVSVALVAFLTSATGALLGVSWRALGERAVRRTMNAAGIYRDDHEASSWQSIMHQPAQWTAVQIHIENQIVLEANFGQMVPSPRDPITINEDGIATYITGIYQADNSFTPYGIAGNSDDIILTYIPRASIKRVDISWRLPKRHMKTP